MNENGRIRNINNSSIMRHHLPPGISPRHRLAI
jgi:hypothetical protein